jgi:hypothetical protein
MKLNDAAMTAMAECISRGEHITLDLNTADAGGAVECDRCGLLTALVIPVRGISTIAVYDMGTVTACALCDGRTES